MNSQAWLVLTEGFLSFFSPCVLPILPVYMAYLSKDAMKKELTGWRKRLHVLMFTIAFVLGICTVFFIAAMSAKGISGWLNENRLLISLIGGILIVFFGCLQLGWIQIPFLMRDFRIQSNQSQKEAGSIFQAYAMGFLFSFAWTPCIGPMLSSVIVAAAASGNSTLMIICYAAGFVIPFILLGIFTEEALKWLEKKKNLLPYAMKLGGIILIVMGLWMSVPATVQISSIMKGQDNTVAQVEEELPQEPGAAPNFRLKDQYGNTHTLSDYKGKVVMLQFFATWCGFCKEELPYVQEIYENLPEDLVILVVNQPGGREMDIEGVTDFLDDHGYTFPVVFDEGGKINRKYGVTGLPTTFMINKEGELYGYMPGAMNKDMMLKIIDMARNNEEY